MRYDLTAAILGSGFMGKEYIAKLSELVKNIIICTNDEETGKALAEQYGCKLYTNYDEMLENEKIDFVGVCLPTHLHCSFSKKAMEKGIAVLCEKPFASSEDEAMQMIRTAEENGVLLMIGHCVRFSKEYEYVRRCVEDKRFGKLLSFNSYRENPMPSWSVNNWLFNTALSGGIVRDLHVHDTDMIVGILGSPKSVYTTGSATTCRTVYGYGNGVTVSSSASWRNIHNIPTEKGYDALFEKAFVKNVGGKLTVYADHEQYDPLENEEFSEFFQDGFYLNELKYFCHCLVNGEKPLLCLPSDSYKTIAVSCAESRSLEKHEAEAVSI